MGLVGGGPGSFIGPVHRLAAEMDREIELVAGAFSRDAGRSSQAGEAFAISRDRAYASLEEMLTKEAERPDGIDFVSIATPNHHHAKAASAALSAGMPVFCDKPMTATLPEAEELARLVHQSGKPFAVSYTYSGYPLVREARARIAAGLLGNVRKVVVEYPQGWLAHDASGKQAEWRTNPAQAGLGGCIADIGVHAFHLAEFITGLRVNRLLADLGAVVPGRVLDDDCAVLLRFNNGARGVLLASQVEVGELNGLNIRVYGENGGLVWRQEEPSNLTFHLSDGRTELIRAGTIGLHPSVASLGRTPGGHPEGYLEAFANLYRDFSSLLRGGEAPCLPGVGEGLRGMQFISAAVKSSKSGCMWTELLEQSET